MWQKDQTRPSLNTVVYAKISILILTSLNSHAECVDAPQSWWRSSLERRMWPKRCKFVGCMQDKHVSSELYIQICQLGVCLSDCACVYEFAPACESLLMFVSLVLSEVTSVLAWNQQSRWDNRLIFRWSARTSTAKTPATHRCSMESWTTAWWQHKYTYYTRNKMGIWLVRWLKEAWSSLSCSGYQREGQTMWNLWEEPCWLSRPLRISGSGAALLSYRIF